MQTVFFDIGVILTRPSFEEPARLNKGILSLLRQLKSQGLKIGLIANVSSPGRYYEKILKEAKVFSYFDVLIWSSEVGFKKPHPMIFQQAILGSPGVVAGKSVYVSEDFERDILSANRAGLWGIWVNQNQESRENPFSREIKKVSEIPKILENGFFLNNRGDG